MAESIWALAQIKIIPLFRISIRGQYSHKKSNFLTFGESIIGSFIFNAFFLFARAVIYLCPTIFIQLILKIFFPLYLWNTQKKNKPAHQHEPVYLCVLYWPLDGIPNSGTSCVMILIWAKAQMLSNTNYTDLHELHFLRKFIQRRVQLKKHQWIVHWYFI